MVTSECAKSTSNILLGTCIAPGLDRLSCNLLPMTDFFFFFNESFSFRKQILVRQEIYSKTNDL